MAKPVVPLTDPKIQAAKYNPDGKGNKLFDGGGLFILLKPSGSKSWRMKYKRPSGKEDTLVFGDYPNVPLKLARKNRDDAQALLAQGIDPKEQDRKEVITRKRAEASTFKAVALEWHAAIKNSGKWCDDHAARVLSRIEANLFPALGARRIDSLDVRDLMAPLEKLEKKGVASVAERMKQATAGIMTYAAQRGYIKTNPATDLKGAITPYRIKHRPALPLDQLPNFLARVEGYSGHTTTRLAMRLTLLVFIRSSELRFARWDEIDFDRALWTIPAERERIDGVKHSHRGSKMKAPHLVPLSRQALAVLEQLREISGHGALLFPGERNHDAPISENTINQALRRMGYDTKKDVCLHGFRTLACGSLVQSGLWQEDAVERQMSHKERNKVRLAYTHMAEFMKERRLMMQWWADYLDANQKEHLTPHDFAHPEEAAHNAVRLTRKAEQKP